MTVGRLRIALLPLALLLVLVNLPVSTSSPQPQVKTYLVKIDVKVTQIRSLDSIHPIFPQDINLNMMPSQPQPGLGFLGDLWNIELELWRQAYANVQAERRQAR